MRESGPVVRVDHSPVSRYAPEDALPPVVVGVSGASGAVLAQRTIQRLGLSGRPLVATCSQAGQRVWREELGQGFKDFCGRCEDQFALEMIDVNDIGATIASGRRKTAGMLIVPCSMDTVSALAHGRSTNLLERAADVTLKEGRRLVIVPRESPLSPIHLENMLKLAQIGVRIVLPVPAFYLQPRTLDEIVDDIVERALVALGLEVTR